MIITVATGAVILAISVLCHFLFGFPKLAMWAMFTCLTPPISVFIASRQIGASNSFLMALIPVAVWGIIFTILTFIFDDGPWTFYPSLALAWASAIFLCHKAVE